MDPDHEAAYSSIFTWNTVPSATGCSVNTIPSLKPLTRLATVLLSERLMFSPQREWKRRVLVVAILRPRPSH